MAASSTPTPVSGNFSLYIHVPFCRRKCPYCHFYSIPRKEKDLLQYLQALKTEWKLRSSLITQKNLQSVYFGGGTPSLLDPEMIGLILSQISNLPQEITLEANPENISLEKMQGFRQIGINRVSIGVQSLDEPLLQTIERTHSAQLAIQAVGMTHEAGIHNISIDLMYDLPNQTLSSWEKTLQTALSLPISHLSLYNLTLEPHTVFYKYRQSLSAKMPSEEKSLKMLKMAVKMTEEAGLKRYEVSAFAKEGYRSQHNIGYWTGRPFLGLGPSAHSFWQDSRFQNIANLSQYCKQLAKGELPVDYLETLPAPAAIKERIAVGLRMLDGIKHPLSLPPETQRTLSELEEEGFIALTRDHLKLTPKGLLFYDLIAERLI